MIRYILKNKQNNKCVFVYDIIGLNIMKMKMKINHIVNRYDINRHILDEDTNTNIVNIKFLAVSMMMLICIKQNLKLNP